jgi:LysR family transcriptional regulator, transcriptional activator of nhaA
MQNWLNYHHLFYFWAVVREGGVGPAARKLNVSQPTISAQIRQLEEAFGEKLLRKAGRRLQPTDAGQVVLGYADDIFSLGNELLLTIRQSFAHRSLRLYLGVVDAVSKKQVSSLLKSVINRKESVHLICREGSLHDLAGQLATYKLDAILADEPLGSILAVKAFNTRLAHDPVVWAAKGKLVSRLKNGFPLSLDGAPLILPSEEMPMRRVVEAWFRKNNIQPRIVAEVQDSALMKNLAADGAGAAPLPASIMSYAGKAYGLVSIGVAEGAFSDLFLCTVERKAAHPLLRELLERHLTAGRKKEA